MLKNKNFLIISILLSFFLLFLHSNSRGEEDFIISSRENLPDVSTQKSNDIQRPQYVPGEIIVKFKSYVPEGNINVDTYKEKRDEYLKGLISSKSIEELKKKYGVKIIDKLFREPKFIKLEQAETEITKALAEAFPGLEEKFEGGYSNVSTVDLSSIQKLVLSSDADVLAAASEFSRDPSVEYAEPNYICNIDTVPDDPYFNSSGAWGQDYDDLWGLKKIQCEKAWDITTGSAYIIVAVVDTGLDYQHEDIKENIWTNEDEVPNNGIDDDRNGYIDDTVGWNFINGNNDPKDGHGHGTHVSGTIAAVGDNGKGIPGISWNSKIMPIKGLDEQGQGSVSGLANALIYAADNGARVINCSWGGEGRSRTLEDAVNYAHNMDVVIVVAAGNSNIDANRMTPANLTNTVAVSAFTNNDEKAWFSNYGSKVDVAAPGVDILSLRAEGTDMYKDRIHIVGGKYYYATGTSMAAPHVSGLASLILSRYPEFTNEEVRGILRSSADDVGESGWDIYSGYGRINAYSALNIDSVAVAKITSPKPDEIFNDEIIQIKGSASGSSFQSYKLSYKLDTESDWTEFMEGFSEVEGNLLGELDVSNLEAGRYIISLSVMGGEVELNDRVAIWISEQNIFESGTGIELLRDTNNGSFGGVLVSADFDRNGYIDIVLGGYSSLLLYLFDENGPVLPAKVLDTARVGPGDGDFRPIEDTQWYGLTTGDFDGDGDLDLVAGNVSGNVYLYSNIGDTSFSRSRVADYGQTAYALASGDFDKDGDMDLVVSQRYKAVFNGDIRLLLNDGYGSFTEEAKIYAFDAWTDGNPTSIEANDFDSDGDIDFILARSLRKEGTWFNWFEELLLFKNRGDGTFEAPFDIIDRLGTDDFKRYNPYISSADFDSDGDIDLVIGDNSGMVEYFENNAGSFESKGFVADFGDLSWGITSTDFDNDRLIDLIIYAARSPYESYMTFKRNILEGQVLPSPQNKAPVLDPIGGKAINEGEVLEFMIRATDPDGDALYYRVSGEIPAGARLNIEGKTASFVWKPSFDESSRGFTKTYLVTFIVDDGRDGTDNEEITITVNNVNRPPVLSPIGNKTVRGDNTLYFFVNANDPDNDPITYSSSNLPKGASFLILGGNRARGDNYGFFRWRPGINRVGEYNVTFIATDGELSDDEIVTIKVEGSSQISKPKMLYLIKFWRDYFIWLGWDKIDRWWRLSYSYRIDDMEWSKWNRKRWVRISQIARDLTRGWHTFSVRAKNRRGVISDPKSIRFYFNPR